MLASADQRLGWLHQTTKLPETQLPAKVAAIINGLLLVVVYYVSHGTVVVKRVYCELGHITGPAVGISRGTVLHSSTQPGVDTISLFADNLQCMPAHVHPSLAISST